MVFQMPRKNVSSLPMMAKPYEPIVMYSLYKKVDGRWFQVRVSSYSAKVACILFGDIITANPKEYSIRKAQFSYNEAR